MAAVVGSVLAFGSTLATSALWRTSVSLDGGDVQSGSVVLLNGSASSQVKNYAFTSLGGSALRPGSVVQAPLVMRNGGTSSLDYRFLQTTSAGSPALPGYLTLRIDVVTGSCATGVGAPGPTGVSATLYDGVLFGAANTTSRRLPVGATETLCVRVGVAPSAPKTVAGATTQTTFTFGAQAA